MNFARLRESMVEEQLVKRGLRDPAVLNAFRKVLRHEFVPPELLTAAYDDLPLPLGRGQTISQPYMVALMSEALAVKPGDRVLEIGTGSGYQSAILAALGAEVFSLERLPELAAAALERLNRLGYRVRVFSGDGSPGLPEFSPYDKIVVTAAAPDVPPALLEQLKDGGRLVIPVGGRRRQELLLLKKQNQGVERQALTGCVFVPLIGKDGWTDEHP